MSDDKSKRSGQDRNRIAMDQDYEVTYWTNELGVSRDDLENAVKSVGNDAGKVREHLRERGGK